MGAFAYAAGATFEKVDKTIAEFVRTKCATNQNLKKATYILLLNIDFFVGV